MHFTSKTRGNRLILERVEGAVGLELAKLAKQGRKGGREVGLERPRGLRKEGG